MTAHIEYMDKLELFDAIRLHDAGRRLFDEAERKIQFLGNIKISDVDNFDFARLKLDVAKHQRMLARATINEAKSQIVLIMNRANRQSAGDYMDAGASLICEAEAIARSL